MAKRGDNIHKRKDGRWEGRYKKGRRSDGTIQYGSVYGKTYAEVKEKLKDTVTFTGAAYIPQKHVKNFEEVLNLWMDNNRIRLKGATINKYQNLIETHILPELGNIKISDLTSTIINTYLSEKMKYGRLDDKGGLSSSYVKSIMLIINAAIQFAVKEGICTPLKTPISKPTLTKKNCKFLITMNRNNSKCICSLVKSRQNLAFCFHFIPVFELERFVRFHGKILILQIALSKYAIQLQEFATHLKKQIIEPV